MLKNIFLVEDDEDDQLFFKEAIQQMGDSFYCTIASNGRKALEILNTSAALPDIIFLDINMPELNGFECLRELKKSARFNKIPVVILSTSISMDDILDPENEGVSMFFNKPSSFKTLSTLLKNILDVSSFSKVSKIKNPILR
ncbi:MAG: response regulator [Bacteroidia bacterium]